MIDLPNGVASDDFITIDVTAHVDNVVGNQDGTLLGNNASVSFTAPGGGTITRNFDADASAPGLQPLNLTVVEPVLALTKSANPLSVSLGDQVTFTLLIDHIAASHADAYDVTVVDTLPAGLTYVAGSASIAPTVVGQTLTFPVGTLTLVTDNTTITFHAQVASNAAVGVPLANNAALTYGSIPGATGAPGSGRNGSGAINDYTSTSSASVTPNANAQIRADKTVAMVVDADGSGNLTPGDTVEWTIVLTNNGPAVTNVEFTDSVPANTTYVAGSLTTTKGTPNVALPSFSVAVGPMAANEVVTMRFRTTVNVNVFAGTVLSNQGSVDSDQTVPTPTDGDGNPGNGNQPTTILVNGVPALAVTKTQAFPNDSNLDGQLNPGETIRYTLVVTSTGTSPAANVVFTDPIPANTSVLTVTSTIGTVASTAPPTVNLGPMVPGASATITIDVQVSPAAFAGTIIVNQGNVSGQGLASVPSNTVSATVAAFPTLQPPTGNKTVTFIGPNILEWRMVWINSNNVYPLAVRVRDPMPAGVTYVPGSLSCAPQGTTSLAGCAFDGLATAVVVDATLGPDSGNRGEAAAANKLVVTFRTTLNTNLPVLNVAVAYWDANGNGTVSDDMSAGQVPLGATAQYGAIAVPVDRRELILLLCALLMIAGGVRLRKRG